MKDFAALALLILTALQVNLASAQPLHSHPDVNQALQARWNWASSEALGNRAWVAWQFTSVLNENVISASSFGFQHGGLSLDALLAGNTSPQQGFATSRRLAILAEFRDGQLVDIDTIDAAQPVQFAGPVYWLGEATSTASYRLLVSMLDADQSTRLNRGLIRAIGLHNHSERTAFLNSLLSTADWSEYRRPVIFALTLQHATAVETLLLQIAADRELDTNERRLAIGALRYYGSDASLALLLELTAAEQHDKLRAEAVESLAWFNPAQVIPTLQQLAWFDDNNKVRDQAIDSLARLHTNDANALILGIARDHPSAATREQAMHQLQKELF